MKAFFSIILAFAISIGSSIGPVEAGPLRKAKYVAKSTVQKAKYVGHRVVKGTRKVVHTAVATLTP